MSHIPPDMERSYHPPMRRCFWNNRNRRHWCLVGIIVVLVSCTFSGWWVPLHLATLVQRLGRPTVHIYGRQEGEEREDDEGETPRRSCAWDGRTWKCRRCRATGGGRPARCTRLERRRDAAAHHCSHPPAFISPSDDDDGRHHAPVRTRANGDRTLNIRDKYIYHRQPSCTVEGCWDLSRGCRRVLPHDERDNATASSPPPPALTLYVNGSAGVVGPMIDYAIAHSRYPLVRVDDHRDACLTVVFPSTYRTHAELRSSSHWREPRPTSSSSSAGVGESGGAGRNHLLWRYSRFGYEPRLTSDNAFQQFDAGWAAVASEALERGYLRAGYDMALPLPTKRSGGDNPTVAGAVDDDWSRPLLIQFRGAVQATDQVGYHHRWLAGMYWEDKDDVAVDVRCTRKDWRTRESRVTRPYRFPPSAYGEWMARSVFGFAPGGSGPGSYRFGEILRAGGVPVVTDNFVPPFFPEVDWTGCLVVVSSTDGSDVVDLPARLRRYRRDEPAALRRRRIACAALSRAVLGTTGGEGPYSDDDRVAFTKAMEIWFLRVRHALEYQTAV